jgi:hypothetical protein
MLEVAVIDQLGNPEKTPEPEQQDTPAAIAELTARNTQIVELEKRFSTLEREVQAKQESGLFGISLPLWLAGASGLIGLMAILRAGTALGQVNKQSAEVHKLKEKYQSLQLRIGGVEVQIEQERIANRNRTVAASAAAQVPIQAPLPPQISAISWPVPQPAPETASGPEPITKSALINALNASNRQPLREAARAELNITTESENALAMGKAIGTELEEVSGGGSYWLISAEGQYWLFPTDRTLKGFVATQPSKGLFHYEQQTVAQAQLAEPALLEAHGSRWCVKTMGKIVTP